MKKTFTVLCLVLIAICAFSGTAFAATAPNVTAAAAIALDYDTGEVLYAKDIDTMHVPASMTKIMTAYIIYEEMEQGNITKTSQFNISSHAKSISNDSSYPMAVPLTGSTISVDTLLKLIMVPSASASCIVAAENISGSEAAFVQRMNATAKEMGIKTAYQNCHGARPHYVTARSVAVLIQNFIRNYPDILNYTSLTSVRYNGVTYNNTNKLLPGATYAYPGADGFKTGTIPEAGYCLASTATKDGRRAITVVMRSSSTNTRHTDSRALLNYAFAEISARDAARSNATVTLSTEHPLRIAADMTVSAVFANVSTPFEGTVTLAVDGKTCDTWTGEIKNGTTAKFTVNLDTSYVGKTTVSAVVSYPLANGNTRSFSGDLAVSDKAPAVFRDTAYHWAEDDIDAIFANGTVQGYPDGTFRPENNVTRGEFATMIVNNFKLTAAEDSTALPFEDINGHWAEECVNILSTTGIVEGFDGKFRPDDNISRQEAAAILGRLLALDETATETTFADNAAIADWAAQHVAAVTAAGIVKGYPNNTFGPTTLMKRAEAAAMLSRINTAELPLK